MRLALPLAVLATVPVLAACTQHATSSDASSSTAAAGGPIRVTATDSSCEVSTTRTPAGPVTFQVTNGGSKVTEFYLYSADGEHVVGEVENIGPGLQGTLIVTADQGDYVTACPPRPARGGLRGGLTGAGPARGGGGPAARHGPLQ